MVFHFLPNDTAAWSFSFQLDIVFEGSKISCFRYCTATVTEIIFLAGLFLSIFLIELLVNYNKKINTIAHVKGSHCKKLILMQHR